MSLTNLKLWTAPNGTVWHTMWEERPGYGVDNLSMPALKFQRSIDSTIAWAQMHKMHIEDLRT